MLPSGRHTDWIWPFSYIPRTWTSFLGKPPRKLLGTSPEAKPIPDSGWELLWPLYFAARSKGGWYIRIGIRWDDVDQYYTWPSFTIKHFKTTP